MLGLVEGYIKDSINSKNQLDNLQSGKGGKNFYLVWTDWKVCHPNH